jgi:SAM-dependent methyltransferase
VSAIVVAGSERPTAVEEGAGIYYTGTYWNDYPVVAGTIHRRLSGDPNVGWMEHFSRSVDRRRFERALILNCGNGHVERDLLRVGLIQEAVGVDYASDLLEEARREAGELPLTYHRMDTNTADFPGGPFDLVVNSAAGHHIARIDRVFRRVCQLLPEDGWFVSFDYVGPHRNQYPWEQWEAADTVNEGLPDGLRQTLNYPHLPTMLVTDPTEAIHSELILETIERYFVVRELRPLGGAIAYLLLTHNAAIANAPESVRAAWIDQVLDADDRYLADHPDSSLFAYVAAQPDKGALESPLLDRWSDDEDRREAVAAENGGEYYPLTLLQRMQLNASNLHTTTQHLASELQQRTSQVEELRAELQALRTTFPLKPWQALGGSRVRRVLNRFPLAVRTWRAVRRRIEAIGD